MIRTSFFAFLLPLSCLSISSGEPLPGTTPFDWEGEDFSERILDEAHSFVDRQIEEAANRTVGFPREASARTKWIEESIDSLRAKLGVVDERPPVRMTFYSDSPVTFEGTPAPTRVAEAPGFEVYQVRWSVLPSFDAEGLYVTPSSLPIGAPAPPAMVLLPDADETPEDVIGLNGSLPGQVQMGLRFASAGFRILIPTPLSRERFLGSEEDRKAMERSDQSNREWIYRQGFQMGRHPLGYEIQSVLAAIDWLEESRLAGSVTVAGYGEGGRVALYAAALDRRIDHAFLSGAFSSRRAAWSEPIERNVFGLLPDHNDAEVAALIAPRTLLVEHCRFPEVIDRKGDLATPSLADVEEEFRRIGDVLGTLGAPPNFLLHEAKEGNRADFPAVAAFLQTMGVEREISRTPPIALLIDSRSDFDPAPRQNRIREGMENHVQRILDRSEETRREAFFYKGEPGLRPGRWSVEKSHETISPASFVEFADTKRAELETSIIGRFDEEWLAPVASSRKVAESDSWTAWDIVLEVHPGFHAWGTLLLPKDLEENERRPVVVCQHGRNGVPRDTIDRGNPAYNDFAARLAERGFITFAPFNLYRGEDRYRWLDRKANQVGCTLFSFIHASHAQFIAWLKTRPEVDPNRIAFYGLSYGGETAVRIPALLEDYRLSICSGDFNQWTRKVADPEFPRTFMKTIEWEMPYWNMGNTFDYGDLAGLIFPRPFFVERGHNDGVSQDEWVAYEYARVRRLYTKFGLPDHTGIEFFLGGHSINGEGSFEFLHRHLSWPAPEASPE